MNGTYDIIMFTALGCIIWAITALILITRKISKKGERINPLLFNIILLRNLSKYQDLTQAEKGKTGPLFYHFVIPMWIAFILVLIWVLLSL